LAKINTCGNQHQAGNEHYFLHIRYSIYKSMAKVRIFKKDHAISNIKKRLECLPTAKAHRELFNS
ncbi:MAG: hypothetical protein II489_08140, partial [Bacteroidaceae bacterium]|nr:hypothetical protein [Bacteroidaceae bacterium]